MIEREASTAANIKSDHTRQNVTNSLGAVARCLKASKPNPNGLAVFCGTRDGSPSCMVVEPPHPLKQHLYRCDDHFHTSILKKTLSTGPVVGFLAIDTKDAGWGLLGPGGLTILDQTGSGVPGKHRQGGQSAKRFEKLREMHLNDYYHRVALTTRKHFLDDHQVDRLVVSGPGPTKEAFLKDDHLEYRLRGKVVGVLDTSYAGSEGVREAFALAGDLLKGVRLADERRLVETLLSKVGGPLAAYGLDDVMSSIRDRSAETVLVADDPTHPIDHLGLLCSEHGIRLEVISHTTEHGRQLTSLGGVAVIRRY